MKLYGITKTSKDKKRYIRRVDFKKGNASRWVFGDFTISKDPESYIKEGSYKECEQAFNEYENKF